MNGDVLDSDELGSDDAEGEAAGDVALGSEDVDVSDETEALGELSQDAATGAAPGWATDDGIASWSLAGCCCTVQSTVQDPIPVNGYDTNGDGIADAMAVDGNGDGSVDQWFIDTNGDGVFDEIRAPDGTLIGVPEQPSAQTPVRPGQPDPQPVPDTGQATTPYPAPTGTTGQPQLTFVMPGGEAYQVPAVDADGDGIAESAALDQNGDGKPDLWLADQDGDGRADTLYVDTDGDGKPDGLLRDPSESGNWNVEQAQPAQPSVGVTPASTQSVHGPDPIGTPDPIDTVNTFVDVAEQAAIDMNRTAVSIWNDLFPNVPIPSQDTGMILAEAIGKLPEDSEARHQLEALLVKYNLVVEGAASAWLRPS